MATDEHEYFRERARDERELAEVAQDAKVAEIHLKLARMYAALAAEGESSPPPLLSEDSPSMLPF